MGESKKPAISIDSESGLIRVGKLELDAEVLCAMARGDARVLWAFVKSTDGSRITPVPYDEKKVIWLEPRDLSYAAEAEAEKWSDRDG